jgi:hypothetical protein
VSPEEQEVTLVVQCHHLATTELGKRGEELAEHATNGVTEKGGEAVEDELGGVGRRAGVSLVVRLLRLGAYDLTHINFRSELHTGQLEVGSRSGGEVDDGNSVYRSAVALLTNNAS